MTAQSSEASLQAELGHLTLHAQNFRGLARVEWSPQGVCLLTGPNGSGKSALLAALAFLREAFAGNVPRALTLLQAEAGLRRLHATESPEVVIGIKVGEASWELCSDECTGLRGAWEAQTSPALAPLVEALRDFQVYGMYSLDAVRRNETDAATDEQLHPSGQNLFSVLRTWKASPQRFRDQFAWALHHARRAFPGIIDDLELEASVMCRAPDGLLVGLLHLAAVASAKDGAVIAIEEMENQLHPHAIRSLLAAMREIAEERRLTILLTTHSPVLMNAFKEHPDQFYVMEPGREVLPVSLDQLHDPEWLAHFSLGDLYDRMEFGAPRAQDGVPRSAAPRDRVLRNL